MLLKLERSKFLTGTSQFFCSENGLTVGSDKFYDGNIANGDGCRGIDAETSYIF